MNSTGPSYPRKCRDYGSINMSQHTCALMPGLLYAGAYFPPLSISCSPFSSPLSLSLKHCCIKPRLALNFEQSFFLILRSVEITGGGYTQAFSLQLLDSFECSGTQNMLPSQAHIASRQEEPLFSQIEYTGRSHACCQLVWTVRIP